MQASDTNMSDKESNDEVEVISERLQAATTIDSAYNNAQQQQQQGKSSRRNSSNNGANGQSVDGKKSCSATTTTTTTIDDYVLVRNIPELNLPEKIILVIDTVREQKFTPFKFGTGATFSPLYMIKRAVENFICAKATIQPGVHEYALMSLDSQGAFWLCDYTSNIKTVVNHLEGIAEDVLEEEQRTYDLGQLFETIHARTATPAMNRPMFVSRVILIYGRSNSIPKFRTGHKYLENLTENPCSFLDVLFVHEPASDDNMCEAVYAEIAALDTTNYSYIFEVGRNPAKLHDNMAKLLAHPLQRPLQKDASYTFISNAQEVHTNV
ncbi:BRISC and BRCA1-A complex member 1 isoform X1 [Polyergus mexicanus]|uniref:BRISC and BRCA1-A complex member 1 isoform X1 n=2 Tax=Polyergus mexicanus TaxID=615972 RepID=UPI0038B533FD